MSTPITHTYQGIKITYDVDSNKWTFELRGRERSCDSLKSAQDIIDTPVKDKATFKRIKAWHQGWRGKAYESVEVTSIAAKERYGSGYEAWISGVGGRSKVRTSELYPVNAHNDHLVDGIKKLMGQIEKLQKDISELESKLQEYEVKDEEKAPTPSV